MKRKQVNRMLAWLSKVLTCPVCDSHYATESTRVLESRPEGVREEGSMLVHSDCQNCRSSVMFNVAMLGQEIFSIGVISDLNAIDAIKFRQAKALTADDVLEVHRFFETFEGDFEKAFAVL